MINALAEEVDLREVSASKFVFSEGFPHLLLDGELLPLCDNTFDSLLNALKIPIKYLRRCAEINEKQAQSNINLWLGKAKNIGAVIDGGVVTRIYDSRKLFVPHSFVRSAVCGYLENDNVFDSWDGATYVAIFSTNEPDIDLVNGDSAFVSIRIQFSECFLTVPKIDAVLTVRGKYENYYFPVQGRKFRSVQMTPAQIVTQITEFVELVTEQVVKLFVPSLNRMIEANAHLNAASFVGRLCSELRISRKIGVLLMDGIGQEEEIALHELVRRIGNNVLPEVRPEAISLDTAREIEVALSKAIYKGSFK